MGQILRVIAEEEQIKLAVITAPDMVEQARKIHASALRPAPRWAA